MSFHRRRKQTPSLRNVSDPPGGGGGAGGGDHPGGKINVLRNDVQAALVVTAACGGSFIRVNVLSGKRFINQGIIESQTQNRINQNQPPLKVSNYPPVATRIHGLFHPQPHHHNHRQYC